MEFKEVSSTVLYVVLGIILAFGINQGLALGLGTDLPIVAVESNSMVPTFERGDILILQGVNQQTLEVGDVIVFSPPGQPTPIVHRLIEKNNDGTYQTRGDANSKQLPFEKSITFEQIHGKQIVIIPKLGWVKIALSEYFLPNAMIIIVLLVIVYLLWAAISKAG